MKDAVFHLDKAVSLIEIAIDGEEDALSNIPDNLSDSDQCCKMDTAIDMLELAIDKIENAKDNIEDAML